MREPIRLLLVDDDALVLAGIAAVLGAEPDFEVAGTAGDGVEALERVAALKPDVVLMDVRMPRLNGIDATARLVAGGWGGKVVMLTTFAHDEYVLDALRAGAQGFVLKRARPAELADAIRTVARGDALLFPEAIRRLVTGGLLAAGPAARPPWARRLTAREFEVLGLVARGLTNAEIAATLYVGVETVKTHVSALLAKSGARDRTSLVVAAYEGGMIRTTANDGPP